MHPLSNQKIIFLPGLDGTGISFEPFGKVLPKDVTVNVIKYPTDRLLNFDETVQCAKDQIQSEGKDAIVLAESFSGPVAVALIASGQLKAKCLILCATFAKSPRPVLLKAARYLPIELLISVPLPRFIFSRIVEGGETAADVFLALLQKEQELVPPNVIVHRLKVIDKVDVRGLLPKLRIPCCYIQATADRTVPASNLFDFTERVPDLRVKRIKGPHFILQAKPEECLEAVQNFVSLVTNKSGSV